ncbi:MAG: hypothetical protein QW533_06580, partial [Thermoplasmata archaeon]
MKKKDKVLIGIIGTAGLGLLAYYLMKKSAGQPSPQPSPTPSPTPTPTPQPQPQPQPSPSPSPPPQTSPAICQITGCNKLIVFYNNKTYSIQGVNVGWGSPSFKTVDPLDTIQYVHYPAGQEYANEQCIYSGNITVYKNMNIFDPKLRYTFWRYEK